MNERRIRPNVIPWPPLLIVGLTALAIALQMVFPLDPGFAWSRMLGAVLIVSALAIDLWAMKTLNDGRTTILPHRGSSHLVTKGPFQFSRNPIYLANFILMTGLGLFFANGWMVLLAPVDAALTHLLAVRREENHLIAMFGFEYEAYCRRVRRWI
ncbi:methyltransferase family protein [Hoeflea sp.]|uniref:methyltransferase family protein n=1 Tax=Hoeflea sp. TaxID=1940281 RepID=UPI003BAF4B6D